MWRKDDPSLARGGTQHKSDMDRGLYHVFVEILTACYQMNSSLSKLDANFIDIENPTGIMGDAVELFFHNIVVMDEIFDGLDGTHTSLVRRTGFSDGQASFADVLPYSRN